MLCMIAKGIVLLGDMRAFVVFVFVCFFFYLLQQDSDVALEKLRIDNANSNDDLIQIKNLKKVDTSIFLTLL